MADAGLIALSKRGRAVFYNSADALKAIYRSGESSKERLDAARAEIAELELAERRGELLPKETVLAGIIKRESAIRARALALPSKLAPQIAPPVKVQQVEDLIRSGVYEFLSEMAGNGESGGL
jgi:hypothetical protein